MREVTRRGIQFYQFPRLAQEDRVVHAVSGRGRGSPRNMSFSVSSKHGDPFQSRAALVAALGLHLDRLAVAGQVHGAGVAVVTRAECTKGTSCGQALFQATDGLLTEERELPLLVTAADCPPVFLFDPDRPAVGLVHSGWRGTNGRIVEKALAKMREVFDSEPCEVRAAIGPGIGPCCYDVGEDLVSQLSAEDRSHLRRDEDGGYALDLPAWIRRQLARAGVPQEAVEESGICTACNLDRFFSHRAEGGDTGRVAAVIALRRTP